MFGRNCRQTSIGLVQDEQAKIEMNTRRHSAYCTVHHVQLTTIVLWTCSSILVAGDEHHFEWFKLNGKQQSSNITRQWTFATQIRIVWIVSLLDLSVANNFKIMSSESALAFEKIDADDLWCFNNIFEWKFNEMIEWMENIFFGNSNYGLHCFWTWTWTP